MGRELKRVALDFSWELNKVWIGFYCPYYPDDGNFETPYHEYICDSWQSIEPPKGDGWQVWETVSEGSPISPVFATSDEMVRWLTDQGYSELAAKEFAKQGWAPSMIMIGGSFYNDIESLAHMKDERE